MNGPEHYLMAERLLGDLSNREIPIDAMIAAASVIQVHATLALAAATADPFGSEEHWHEVLT